MTGDLRKRRTTMFVLVGVCALLAAASALAAFGFDQAWGVPAFVAALVAGFAAQVWFIAGLAKGGRS